MLGVGRRIIKSKSSFQKGAGCDSFRHEIAPRALLKSRYLVSWISSARLGLRSYAGSGTLALKCCVYVNNRICPTLRNVFVLTAGSTFRRLAHLARMAGPIVIGPVVACISNVGFSLNPAHDFTAACTGIDPTRGADQRKGDFF